MFYRILFCLYLLLFRNFFWLFHLSFRKKKSGSRSLLIILAPISASCSAYFLCTPWTLPAVFLSGPKGSSQVPSFIKGLNELCLNVTGEECEIYVICNMALFCFWFPFFGDQKGKCIQPLRPDRTPWQFPIPTPKFWGLKTFQARRFVVKTIFLRNLPCSTPKLSRRFYC